MTRFATKLAVAVTLAALGWASGAGSAAAQDQVARGKYLVTIMGCNDCHTAGALLGKPDMAHMLSGSDVGFEVPGLGVFVGRNLTPDKETGLGNWSAQEIITAFTTGKRPDGRILSPAMPYENFKALTPADAQAIAAFLKSLPPTHNPIPGPFGPNEKITVLYEKIVPGNGMAPPPGK
ncbi:MAG TPA: c-type cytochrome [Stellaceae bacterium]|nr:c-type cytochrome [Stellaceae bacterium]